MCAPSCPTLCDLMDFSLPATSVHGIFQARIQEWVAIFFSRGSSLPGDRTCLFVSPALADGLFTSRATRKYPFLSLLLEILVMMKNICLIPKCMLEVKKKFECMLLI